MKKLVLLVASLGITAAAPAFAAAPPKAMLCQSCHGPNGAKPIQDSYPKLNGQNKTYLISSLKDYRAGKRTGGLAQVMALQAKGLSDAEIEALAAYFSSAE